VLVDVDFAKEPALGEPAPAGDWVHDLDQRPQGPPDDQEVREAARKANDEDRRQVLAEKNVIEGHHHLLGIEAERPREVLDGVDGGAVDVGLAGLAQASVARRDLEALKQAVEGRRPAVHRRGLDDLRRESAPSRRASPG